LPVAAIPGIGWLIDNVRHDERGTFYATACVVRFGPAPALSVKGCHDHNRDPARSGRFERLPVSSRPAHGTTTGAR
jgi:hypothetical protein